MRKRGYFHQYAGGGGTFSDSPDKKGTNVVKVWTFELMIPHPLPQAIIDPSSVGEVPQAEQAPTAQIPTEGGV